MAGDWNIPVDRDKPYFTQGVPSTCCPKRHVFMTHRGYDTVSSEQLKTNPRLTYRYAGYITGSFYVASFAAYQLFKSDSSKDFPLGDDLKSKLV